MIIAEVLPKKSNAEFTNENTPKKSNAKFLFLPNLVSSTFHDRLAVPVTLPRTLKFGDFKPILNKISAFQGVKEFSTYAGTLSRQGAVFTQKIDKCGGIYRKREGTPSLIPPAMLPPSSFTTLSRPSPPPLHLNASPHLDLHHCILPLPLSSSSPPLPFLTSHSFQVRA